MEVAWVAVNKNIPGNFCIFELIDNQYKEVPDLQVFSLHKGCEISIDLEDIVQS
jgi:hypothetical protein